MKLKQSENDMKLFIAEKPSVARAIAEELGVTSKEDGYICCGSDKVTWCFGHLLELAEPDRYTPDDGPKNPKTGKKLWRIEDLPIIPSQWIIEPKADAKKQLNLIGKLLKEATLVINAGDADREGQLLVDEILTYFNNQKPVQRFWVAAHDSVSLNRGLSSMKDNQTYYGLGRAALARSQADWLIGMNLSRAYTLNASKSGQRALVTVGRVQTPTLKLVVDRDRAIDSFQSKPFYTIKAAFNFQGDKVFLADWKPGESQPGLDEDDRLIDLNIANSLVDQVSGQPGTVRSYKKEQQKKHHPKAYSLSDLTLEASNRYGYSAAEVLEAAQSLYETHKLTSYPRTDCGFLPESQWEDSKTILSTLGTINPELLPLIEKADISIKSNTWDDKKVTVHFGIIPTMHKGSKESLSPREKTLYELIVKRYIAQFYPLHEYESTSIDIEVSSLHFMAKGKTIVENGWCDVYQDSIDDVAEEAVQVLPVLSQDGQVHCIKANRHDAKTKPPLRFTEGTLIRAMENIHKFIADTEHKKMLKDGDGIGTPATRASIINELKNRSFIEPNGKHIISTPLGQSIVDTLPEMVKSPVLTSLFERILKTIEQEPDKFNHFMEKQTDFVKEQVQAATQQVIHLKGVNTAPLSLFECHLCNQKLIKRKSQKGYWWACSSYPNCKQTYSDLKGKPQYKEENNHA